MCFKGNQCLSCLRHLSRFHIDNIMLVSYYRAYVESLLWFSLVSWTFVRKWSDLTADWFISAEPSPHYSRHIQQLTASMFLDDSTYFCSLFLLPSSFWTKVSVPRMNNKKKEKKKALHHSDQWIIALLLCGLRDAQNLTVLGETETVSFIRC